MTTAYTISDFRAAMRNGKYAFPGGYPMYFVTSDGGVLSFGVAKKERRNILESMRYGQNDGFWVIACEINWEDPDLYCDHSGKRIESAYAEDGAN